MSFILVVEMPVFLKIRSFICSFHGGEANKGMLNSLYWNSSVL